MLENEWTLYATTVAGNKLCNTYCRNNNTLSSYYEVASPWLEIIPRFKNMYIKTNWCFVL